MSLDIISIHIPKTAGTSFENVLRQYYGQKAVWRVDTETGRTTLNHRPVSSVRITQDVKVLHGHVTFPELCERGWIAEGAKLIVWLRNPVDRVISNYYYLDRRLAELLDEERKNLNILKKMQRSLIEFAADAYNQNRMSKFLEGAAKEDFFFIGEVEKMEADLKRLGSSLGWGSFKIPKVNATSAPEVASEIREVIASFNRDDVKLWQEWCAH